MSNLAVEDGLLHTTCGTPNYVASEIYKAELYCPSWFSVGDRRRLTRILISNPKHRITIPKILKDSWFTRGYHPVKFVENKDMNIDDVDAVFNEFKEQFITERKETTNPRPAVLHAFELIYLLKGLNLSGLFEKKHVNPNAWDYLCLTF